MSKLGAVLASGAFKRIKKYFDYDTVGGAPFLGLKGLVVKAHGSSDYRAVAGAIFQCEKFIDGDIVSKIAEKISPKQKNKSYKILIFKGKTRVLLLE